jgi:pantoate--beta-alanine ligase
MVRERVEGGERRASVLIATAKAMIDSVPGAKIDYISIVDWENLEPLEQLEGEVLVAIAVFFGATRLIDNWRKTVA